MLALRAVFLFGLKSIHASILSVTERITLGECLDSAAVTSGDVLFPEVSRVGVVPSAVVTQAESDIQAAAFMSISYGQSFKIVTERFSKEQYVLTHCGMSQPSTAELDALVPLEAGYQRKFLTIPLQRVIAGGTTVLGFLRRLGVQDRVSHIDQSATGPCWQKALSCNASFESSWGGNATLRTLQMETADAVFMDCSGDCAALRAQQNAVHFPATKDNGNLHTAEYIKFIAAFFNLEAAANQFFDATVAAYTANAGQSNGPKVAWIEYNTWGALPSYRVSMATYRAQMVDGAGGRMVNASDLLAQGMAVRDIVASNPAAGKVYILEINASETTAATVAQTLMNALSDVDIVVDETYAPTPRTYTFTSFLTGFHLTESSNLKFVKDRMVLRWDGTLSESDGLDWFESRVSSPDWAVEGLARYVKNDTSKQQKYFRNIATGEMPVVILASQCTDTLPACDATANEAPIVSPRQEAGLSGAQGQGFPILAAIASLALWLC
ncbi:unnamed protein product [Symbiodinium sp. CCMP2592]|nr:unnamed protein product [Symbiodinium sp. CCMP2592]